eukprot:TRINITY_DN12248_c0_g1_i1.p1 TRINITY_DN12248_c0_g1~~TRINITY_DN12248_c0_g1_i1.p1  ORF type:complete len:466 (-),score=68.58 TRINITY_DN12248_c0_g1_i1:65-1384(-)
MLVGGITTSAFVYLYPLVLVDITRNQFLDQAVRAGAATGGLNMLSHARQPVQPEYKGVVRPNFDTLYTSAQLELTEPVVLSLPAIHDRFYVMQFMDAWSNTFSSLGTRTTGTVAGNFVLCGPGFEGTLPVGTSRIDSPTKNVWMIGRLQILAAAGDIDVIHGHQDNMSMALLSKWVKDKDTAKRPTIPSGAPTSQAAPPDVLSKLTAEQYFEYGSKLLKENIPPAADIAEVAVLKDGGIVPGQILNWSALGFWQRQKLLAQKALQAVLLGKASLPLRKIVDGWMILPNNIGNYSTDYQTRAAIALSGLGANIPADAIYSSSRPLPSTAHTIRFEADELPPVKAFWSVTLYDDAGYVVKNELNRYSLGSQSNLTRGTDGSVTLYLQSSAPTDADEVSNWLPTPRHGTFVLTSRFYHPESLLLNGSWHMPPVELVQDDVFV